MTTEDYLKCYAALNSRLLLTPWTYTHADRPAPMLDATQPEVWEEVDEHYIPTMADIFAMVKPKKVPMRVALVALIEACEEGDPEQIAAAVTRARGAL